MRSRPSSVYDNITHVSPHVAPPPSLDIVSCLPVSGVKGTDRAFKQVIGLRKAPTYGILACVFQTTGPEIAATRCRGV